MRGTAAPEGDASVYAFIKHPLTGAQEPAAYQGTVYVTYQVPVHRDGKVIGFAGTAATLAGVDARISKIKLYDSGYAFAVSGKGVLLSTPDHKNVGKLSLATARPEAPEFAQVAKSVAAGKSGQVETIDPWTGKHIVLTWSKIDAAGWSFLTAVPVDEVLASTKSLQNTLFLVGLIALMPARRADRRRRQQADQADPHRHRGRRAAQPRARSTSPSTCDSDDEVGRLAVAFEETVEYLREKADAAEKVAGGDLTVTVEPRSEKDVLGKAFNHLVDDLRAIVGQVSDDRQRRQRGLAPHGRHLRRGRPRDPGDRHRDRRGRRGHQHPGPEGRVRARGRQPCRATTARESAERAARGRRTPPSRRRRWPPTASSPPVRRRPRCAAWPSPPPA